MQMLGSVAFFAAGMTAVSGLSVSIYAALPERVLAFAERHGRFQGLRVREGFAGGSGVEAPPLGSQMALAE